MCEQIPPYLQTSWAKLTEEQFCTLEDGEMVALGCPYFVLCLFDELPLALANRHA